MLNEMLTSSVMCDVISLFAAEKCKKVLKH